jgi:hypothetical protein
MHRTRAFFFILALLSLAVGLVVYAAAGYSPAILVIEARTGAAGSGRIVVEGTGIHAKATRSFAVDDSQGEVRQYVVDLPSTQLKSVRIAPLTSAGGYEIDRITLSNDAVSYVWDGQGGCTQKVLTPKILRSTPCGGEGPGMAANADFPVIISALPDVGFNNSPAVRIFLALLSALSFAAAALWLFRPVPETSGTGRIACHAVRGLWLLAALLYGYHFYVAVRYAVDVPFQDEWTYFDPDALPSGLTWRWLFSFHNDHRHVLTNLLSWLNFRLFGLDFVKSIVLNNVFFGCLMLALVKSRDIIVGRNRFALFPVFMMYLLSPLAYENHSWGLASTIHLFLLFAVMALWYAYHQEITRKTSLAFSLLAVLCAYNFSAGVVIAFVYLLCNTVFMVANIAHQRISREEGWRIILLNWAVIGVGCALWFYGYKKPTWSQQWVCPINFSFWDYFLNILSLGFGFTSMNMLPGIFCLLFSTAPLVLLLSNQETRWQRSSWHVLSAILGILAALALIAVGRTSLCTPKASRYSELGFLLIPYASVAWWLCLKAGRRRTGMLLLFWSFCFFGYRGSWSTDIYPVMKQESMEILECVERYYRGEGDGACQEPNPALKAARVKQLDLARQLKIRFTQRFELQP